VRDDGQTLRRLAQLRRLMQVRSGLGPEAIDRINAAVKEIWTSVDTWSRRRGSSPVATLTYSLTPDSLTLTVRDEAGWLPDWRGRAAEPSATALAAAQFDQVVVDEANRSLRLVKRFAAPGPGAGGP
jgi:hypothetical protein